VAVPEDVVRQLIGEVAALDAEHRQILESVQGSKARAATVEATLQAIQTLSPRQADLLNEAALAVRNRLHRSAVVACYAAVVDALHQRIDRLGKVAAIATLRKWKLATAEDLHDYADHNVAEAAKDVSAISKAQMKSFHGLLHRRNQAAHPTSYAPTVDEALGFISESLALIAALAK
jgi:hypothetical protein